MVRHRTPDSTPELALSFANTFELSGGRIHDRIATPDDLRRWLAREVADAASIVESLRSPPVARTVHDEALRLRSAIRELLETYSGGTAARPGTILVINRALVASSIGHEVMVSGGVLTVREQERCGSPLALLAPIARSAGMLLAGVDPGRLRRCAAPQCPVWFVDSSKGGRRRWCSMARCGNRRKAARHRERHPPGS
jgi:predicted RNA-binding Zn ribbon-like protein